MARSGLEYLTTELNLVYLHILSCMFESLLYSKDASLVSLSAAIRISYGMIGILFRRIDLDAFQEYMEQNVARLPPDLIWKEWANPDTTTPEVVSKVRRRAIFVYKQVLLEHIGTSSTFKVFYLCLANCSVVMPER